ncbi:MAG TPA: NADH-quinone oxidoreductase subunit L [Thermoplasmata archaeon]|nr:NADH-quinone oxidoreductase subunit L [Thermoplasmata archaeon]
MFEYAWFIILLPIFAFVVIGIAGRRLPEGGGHVAVGAVAGSFVLSAFLFYEVLLAGALGAGLSVSPDASFEWIPGVSSVPGFDGIRMGLLIDNLSAVMLLLVSFLSMLIVVYSLGYMRKEEGKARYYAEISLFIAGMLGTVSADNFLQLLIFWEIMGLCSYLLIGFWYYKPEAAKAAKKAFMVTRVGDVLFLIGILIIWNVFHTFSFEEIRSQIPSLYPLTLTPGLLVLIPLLLFGGAVGKSAQFPLHAWLPDAMEGPTTVSALIHAATMVKAGVYLTARAFVFLVPPEGSGIEPPWTAILVIAGIGGFTALFSATMALTAYDIKRVLAFSTISQLGYMFLGLGAGAFLMAGQVVAGDPEPSTVGYSAALFHLFNHAFFKALLFLSAGSVIHAVHTNDMRAMGGLGKAMPITSRAMLFGGLALAGILPFSGFFSKGEILSVTFDVAPANPWFYLFYAFGVVTAFLTAFYTFRLWYMTFHGEYRGHEQPHESPPVMTGPLVILAGFALASGLLAFTMNGFGNLVFFEHAHAALPLVGVSLTEYVLEGAAMGVAVLGLLLAWAVYSARRIPAARFVATPGRAFVHTMLSRRYWIDDAYDAFGARVVTGLARAIDWFDRKVVDGIVNAVGRGGLASAAGSDVFDRRVVDGFVNAVSLETVRTSLRLRQRQTGQVQSYAWVVVFGIALLIALIFGISWYLRTQGGG